MKKFTLLLFLVVISKTYSQNQSGKIDYLFIAKGKKIATQLVFCNSIGVYRTLLEKSKNVIDINKNTTDEDSNITIKLNTYSYLPNNLGMLIDLNKNEIIDHKYLPLNVKGTSIDTVYIRDKARLIKWKILNEYKKINNYNCQKAIGYFRGRNYTVWYSNDIPLSLGPWKLNGLPGLILEATDSENKFQFYTEKIELYATEKKIDIAKFKNKKYSTPQMEWEKLNLSMSKISEEISEKIQSSLPRGVNAVKNKKNATILNSNEQLEINFVDVE